MKPSQSCADLVKEFEGYSAVAYPDPGSGDEPWTIGYGTTKYPDGAKVKKGDQCIRSAAEEWLRFELEAKGDAVDLLVRVPLSQHQFDALCSFTYNVGVKNFAESTLRKMVNAAMFGEAAEQFLRWTRASGRVLPGLVKRREEERALFMGEHA